MGMSKKIFHIGIVGGGISGLIAGLEILSAGHIVTIFESRSNTGGRIRTFDADGVVVEAGPEFIHGKLTETIGLLKKYKLHYDPVEGKNYNARQGQMKESHDMTDGWDLLLEKMKSVETDLPFGDFLAKNFPGNRYHTLRRMATGFAEGFDLADIETVSTRALCSEWEHGESDQYRIPAGYGTLIHAMEIEFKRGGGTILTNHPVETVQRNTDHIKVSISDNREFSLDKLIVSLPLGVLFQKIPGSESVSFVPSMEEKHEAFRHIGFGTVVKIVLIWNTAFWKKPLPDAQFIFSDYFIPTWWTQYPMDIPMLTGWLGGPKAVQFAGETDDFFLEKAFESLSGIFSMSTELIKKGLKHSFIFNWKKEPWSRGAYSFALAGFDDAKAACRRSIEQRLYFTGEAYYEGPFPGTVEAAIVSGKNTARQLLGEIIKK